MDECMNVVIYSTRLRIAAAIRSISGKALIQTTHAR